MRSTTTSKLIYYTTKPLHWIINGSFGARSFGLFVVILPLMFLAIWSLALKVVPPEGRVPCTAVTSIILLVVFLIYNSENTMILSVKNSIILKPIPITPILQSELLVFMSKAKSARTFEELEFYCQTLRLTSTEMLKELGERRVKMEDSITATDRQLSYLGRESETPFRLALKESHQKTKDFLEKAQISINVVIKDATDMADYLEATLTGLEAKANVGRMLEICSLFSQMHATYRALGLTNDFDTDVKHIELELT